MKKKNAFGVTWNCKMFLPSFLKAKGKNLNRETDDRQTDRETYDRQTEASLSFPCCMCICVSVLTHKQNAELQGFIPFLKKIVSKTFVNQLFRFSQISAPLRNPI